MALLRNQGDQSANITFSSFQSVEKILSAVVQKLLTNDRLKKLLYYSDRHALGLPKLNQEQTQIVLNESILIVPKLKVDPDIRPYIIISLDQFLPLPGETTFRTATLSFDILAAYDHWVLDNFKLRPYAIAGEIDGLVNQSVFSNGLATFIGAKQLVLNEYLGGVSLYYTINPYGADYERYIAE